MVSVLVRGFDFRTSDQQIASHMSSVGNIQSVQRIDDGSVSITYSFAEEAKAAVQQLQQTIIPGNSRYIDVISLDPQEFLAAVQVDDAKAQQFLGMSPEMQHAVMARGTLTTARDPTAVLVQRMKQAKCGGFGGNAGGKGGNPFGGKGAGMDGVGVLVRGFDFETTDEQITTHMASVGTVQHIQWIDQGSVRVSYASAEEANAATMQLQQTVIPGNSRYIDVISLDPQGFLAQHNIDHDKQMQFHQLTPEQQQQVMAKGSLSTARDPTAVLVQRMKDAKGGGGGKGSFGPAKGDSGMSSGPYGGGGGKGGGMGNGGQMEMMMNMMQMMMKMQQMQNQQY